MHAFPITTLASRAVCALAAAGVTLLMLDAQRFIAERCAREADRLTAARHAPSPGPIEARRPGGAPAAQTGADAVDAAG